MSAAVEYLSARGFAPDMIEQVGWRVAPLGADARRYGLPADAGDVLAWRIPYPVRNGRPAFERIRLIDPNDVERYGGKYRQPYGVALDLYDPFGWLEREEPYDALLLIEGEANAVAVAEMAPKLPVVGLPGRGALNADLAARIGALPLVYVWIDPDEVRYEEQLSRIARLLAAEGVEEVRRLPRMPAEPDSGRVMDAADVLRVGGREDGGRWILDALDDPESVPVAVPATRGPALPAAAFPLLTTDDLLTLPPPEWLIDGLVPCTGLSVLYGRSGAGKSFLALDWALCVATGLPWLGREVKQRPVVYVAAEGRGGLGARYRAWASSRRWPDASAIRFLPEAVNVLDSQEVARLREALATLAESPGLVVIDTMARTMVGGDENAARDVGRFVAAIDGLADAVLVVHHTGKDGQEERGSSALRAAADLMAKVTRDGLKPNLRLACEKSKDAEEWTPVLLAMTPAEDSLVLARREDRGERDDLAARIVSYVEEYGPVSGVKIAEGIRKRKEDVLGAIRALEAAGTVERTSRGRVAVPAAAEPARNRGDGIPAGGGSQAGSNPVGVPRREPPRAPDGAERTEAAA